MAEKRKSNSNMNSKWQVVYLVKGRTGSEVVLGYGLTSLSQLLEGLNHEGKIVESIAYIN